MATTAVRASYIWVSGKDTHHDIRGKDRTLYFTAAQLKMTPQEMLDADSFPSWNFDGSSTEQAKGKDTEIIVHPVRAFVNPFPSAAHHGIPRFVVLCECYLPNGQPTPCNTRAAARKVFDSDNAGLKPWFGLEQEYVLMQNGRPFGWPVNGFPSPQGPYYCSNGAYAYGRKHVDRHYELALAMGLKVSGTNGEVMPAQWEFQVGPCEGIEAGDHLVVARWLFLRMLEEENIDIDFSAKPIRGDWNGSGLHTNFSTTQTRAEGGISKIYEYINRLESTIKQDIVFYGKDNDVRLTGHHETSRYSQFSYGVGTRTTSVRVPNSVQQEKKGYLEDRRPAGDADPYLITARLYASATGTPAPTLDAIAPAFTQDWMKF